MFFATRLAGSQRLRKTQTQHICWSVITKAGFQALNRVAFEGLGLGLDLGRAAGA
jgi:hypothetical protein